MTEKEVVELMSSSVSESDWNNKAGQVKRACGGYPNFWFDAIIRSGLANRVLNKKNLITVHKIDPKDWER